MVKKQNWDKVSPDERPHFFKIILPSLTTEEMRIPSGFMTYMAEEETGRAILDGPSGHHWHVKLCRTADGTFLRDGWQNFRRDHSLGDNEFLVFRYDGNLHFNVQIFDKTGCERHDLCNTEVHEESLISNEVKKRGFNTEAHEESPISNGVKKRGRGRPPKKSTYISCKIHGVPPMKVVDSSQKRGRGRPPKYLEDPTHISQLITCKNRSGMKGGSPKRTKAMASRSIHTSYAEGGGCLPRRRVPAGKEFGRSAMSFTSNYPYFMRRMHKSNVSVSFVLKIPTQFAAVHLPRQKTEVLLLSQSNTWTVNYVPTNRTSSAFCGGWTSFARENKLEEGDVCIFELVGECQMRVHIIRSAS